MSCNFTGSAKPRPSLFIEAHDMRTSYGASQHPKSCPYKKVRVQKNNQP